MPRSKQRTPALRDHVLRVAVETLADEGVTGLTTRRVAEDAATSVPAVYELFGDKAGLVRAIFFDGFRRLGAVLAALAETSDSRADLIALIRAQRRFRLANEALAEVMFSRPFLDFAPSPAEVQAGALVREMIVARVQRCIDDGVMIGDRIDIAHALIALTHGLAAQERAGWLGSSKTSVDRRWNVAVNAMIDGFAPS